MRRSSGLGTNYVYLNTKNKFHPIGLGFGGQVGAFRFWIGDGQLTTPATQEKIIIDATHLLTLWPADRVSLDWSFFCVAEMKDCYITKSDCTFSAGRMLQAMNEPIPQITETLGTLPAFAGTGSDPSASSSSSAPRQEAALTTSRSGEENLASSFLIPLDVKEVELWGTGDAKTLEQQRVLMKQQEQVQLDAFWCSSVPQLCVPCCAVLPSGISLSAVVPKFDLNISRCVVVPKYDLNISRCS